MKKAILWSMLLIMVAALLLVTTDDGMGREPKKNARVVDSPLLKIAGITRPFWTPNRIGVYTTNVGQLVSNIPTGSAGMEWPLGSNNFINYASGVWVAGVKNGEIVSAVGEYSVEFQPGKILPDGSADNPNDPRYKLYIINDSDAEGNPGADYLNWPVADGAPVNADGTPQILGTSTAWAVMNDLDEVLHSRLLGSKPMGIEVQTTAFAFNRADVFGDMLFFKFKIINKGGVDIDSTFISFWADIDVGDALDLVGCDTTLSLGYMYKTQADGYYGNVAPAIGYDFFQGPIVPSVGDTALVSGRKIPDYKNLAMTSFAKYINGGPSQYQDPEVASEAYSFMNGFDRVGDPVINPLTGQTTKFWHTGDPVTGEGWLDDDHDDKRFLMSCGPFTLAAGDTQEVVGGMVIARGTDAPSTVRLLKQADQSAQVAYDNNFVLPRSPAVPVAEATTEEDAIVLKWDARAESYNEEDKFHVVNGVPTHYKFQGYNVYQTDELNLGTSTTIKKIATFDIIDGNFQDIKDAVLDEARGEFVEVSVQKPRDTGIQRFLRITQDAIRGNQPLIPNRRYYFAVTSYGYNEESFAATAGGPYAIESPIRPFLVVPVGAPSGTAYTAAYGDTVNTTRVSGVSDGSITPIIVDPTQVTGNTYQVRFRDTAGGSVYDVWDATTNVRKDSNRTNQGDALGALNYPIVDGVMVKVQGAPRSFKFFHTVANAAGPINPPTQAAFAFNNSGFPTSDGLPVNAGVNDRPVNQQATNASSWGIHTADNGSRASFASFLPRVSNSDGNWPRIIPYDWEIRFTAEGSVAYDAFVTGHIFRVPFELWRIGIGTPDDPSDDVRLVPYLLDDDESGTFNLCATHPNAGSDDHTISGGDNDPYTDWIYVAVPTDQTPGDAGYRAWEAAALAIPGGVDDGSFYNVLATDNTLRRLVLVNFNGGSVSDPTFPANVNAPLPETGTVFRIITTKPNSPADVFAYTPVAPIKANATVAKNQAELVNVFPNPYRGFNIEERDPVNRFVTFTHLTGTAKIRIYTLAGELIRTIEHTDGTQIERWDLKNANEIPVASGIYIAHVELPGVGERVLKLAIVQPEERLDVF